MGGTDEPRDARNAHAPHTAEDAVGAVGAPDPLAPPADGVEGIDAPVVTPDPWIDWRRATPARLALGRVGTGMPTDETLRFGWAHAMARDAIHAALDVDALAAQLTKQGWAVERVRSQAADRTTYLRRPDLGRRLDAADAARLRDGAATHGHGPAPGVCLVIGDGLSSLAVERHAAALLAALRAHLPPDTRFAPVVIATQARVALADEVGEAFGATLSVMLIGERPGLSSPDSLGIYLTHTPRRGRHDAERNCISNVRPAGLAYDAAAFKLAWLMREALRRGATGVALKDESDLAVLDPDGRPALPG
jgi:ethanolamine ammonia-lyase small subunit